MFPFRPALKKHCELREAEEVIENAGLHTSESISVLLVEPESVIEVEAAKWEADLIVVGSHGRRGFNRLLLGSVSEAVALHAGCSVEVIRAAQARCKVESTAAVHAHVQSHAPMAATC